MIKLIFLCTVFRLCGYEPFAAEDDREMYKNVIKGKYTFDEPYWDDISKNAKVSVRAHCTISWTGSST